jgi:outer membrane protein OmpA-like peptidoglycan-associated protein
MNIRSLLLAATVLALPAGAMAQVPTQPIYGLYVGGGLGYNWTQNIDIKNSDGAKLEGDGGLAAVGSVGWGLGNGVRVELEGNYRGNHYRATYDGQSHGGANADGYGVFLNGLYDFNVGWPVTPYLGAGIGYEWTQLHAPGLTNGSADGSVAAQGIAGVALPLAVPGLALTAEYRFMATLENTTFDTNYGGKGKIGNQYNHAGLIGVRYAFNAAPVVVAPMAPAPVAAPAPAPARTYLVFFDWDKSDLSARAHQIIAEAAQNSTRVQLTQIEVSGYADRTGTAQYNMVLSRKRADNVAADLVKDGVPKNVIAIQAFGDTHLLVPTAEGVREPQNRRVEIVLK